MALTQIGLRLPASRTVNQKISAVYRHPGHGTLLQQLFEMNAIDNWSPRHR